MSLRDSIAYVYRSHYASEQPRPHVACEHCGVTYPARPSACLNCGSRHFGPARGRP